MIVLGIIPARCGSKRVKNKNIRLLNNKPLIEYTISAAGKSKKLNRVIVSTDCIEIADICVKAGAEVPFLRPSEFANDTSPDKLYLLHALEYLKNNENYFPDAILILRPTSPFKTAEIIDDVIELLEKSNADSVRTMTKAEGVFHPYWMYRKNEKDQAFPFSEEGDINKFYQSQQLPAVYRLNGVVDAIRVNVLYNSKKMYGNDMRILEIAEEYAIDIDTEFDFKLAKVLMEER